MQRVKAILSYDGTHFSGFQKQPNARTVQGEIERALQHIHKEAVKVYASGRTDASVHAIGQVIHFDTPLSIPPERWPKAMNSHLPGDVYVHDVTFVPSNFHARFDAVEKEYRYRILRGEGDVFRRHYTYQCPHPLNIAEMKRAARYFIGTHDFTSFCAANTEVEDMVRTVTVATFEEHDDELVFICRGNGFLYNMVRIMVGTLLEVGQGKRKAEDIPDMIAGKDRSLAGKTAPGRGLYLWHVQYEK